MSLVVAEGVVEVTADGSDIPRDIGRDIERNGTPVENAGGVMGGRLSAGIKTGLVRVGAVVAGALVAATAAVGIGVGAIIANGVKFESAMQSYQAAFTPLLGGADAAQAKLQELSSFAASTPFELTDLAGASQTLLAFGGTAEDLLPDLRMLGDISQGNSEKLSGLALVFGQVQSNGKLMGQDLLQMINQGFNPLQIISERTGESVADLRKRMEQGKISFDEVRQAMVWATSEGGMFYNAMELGSRTLAGAWSTLTDGASILSGALTADLTPVLTDVLNLGVNPLIGGLIDLINGVEGAEGTVASASQTLLNQVESLGGVASDIAGNLSSVVTAVGPALSSVVGTLVGAIAVALPSIVDLAGNLILSIVGAIVANAPALVTAAVPVILNFVSGLLGLLPTLIQTGADVLVALVTGIADSLPTLLPAVIGALVDTIVTLLSPDNLTALLEAGLGLVMGLATGLIEALPALIEALPGIIVGIVTFLVDSIPVLIDAGITLLLSLIGALPEIITGIVAAIPQIIVGIITAVVGAIPQLITAGIRLFIGLIGALPDIIIAIVKAVPQIVTGLYEAFTDPATIRQLANAGGELIKGLWQGINDLGGWLWSKVSGFFDNLVGGIKGFFGIASPSRLFRDEVGTMLGLGMADGILATRDLVAAAAGQLGAAARGGVGEVGVSIAGGPGDGIDPFDPRGPFGPGGPDAPVGAGRGGDVYIENVTLDASNVEDFTDVVDMVKALPQVARAGKGEG